MSYIKMYKHRTIRDSKNSQDLLASKQKFLFDKFLIDNANAYTVSISRPNSPTIFDDDTIRCLITDYSENDVNWGEEKVLYVSLDENIECGCYVKWMNRNWLITGEDLKGFNRYRKLIMKKCTTSVNLLHEGKIYEIPSVVSNLTKYTDGKVDLKSLGSVPDGKRSLAFGVNEVTRYIKLTHRIMLSRDTVYELVHKDDFSKEGIFEFIALQVPLHEKDDLLRNLAWNKDDKVLHTPPTDDTVIGKIIGESFIRSGTASTYKTTNSALTWHLSSKDDGLYIENIDTNTITLKSKRGNKYVGTEYYLYLMDDGAVVDFIKINIIGF